MSLKEAETASEGESGPARRGASALRIHEALRRDILDTVLAPGDPLDETSLSERFGVSRTPVREALVRLVAEGLATSLPNRNTVVSAIDFASLPHYFDALVLFHRLTMRLAAERRSEADLAEIRARQERFAAAAAENDVAGMIAGNRDFHLAVAAAGRNPYYTDLFARLLDEGARLARFYYRTFGDRLPDEYVREHDRLIAAIEARDPDEADRLGREHGQMLVRQLQRFMAPSAAMDLSLGPGGD